MKSKTVNLTDGPILKNIVLFALPLLISNLFQQLYNSIDTAVVGIYAGDIALAAVGSTGALINLLIGFFLGLATGTGVLYAMHYGAGDFEGLKKIIDASYIISIVISLFITAVGIVFAPQLLKLMSTPDDVMHDSTVYLRIYLSGTVVNMIYNVGAGMIRAGGDSTKPLIYLVISGVLNLILDVWFVAGFGMGAAGVAWATVIAQAVSAVLVVIHMMRQEERCRFKPLEMKLDKTAVIDVIRISIPCGLQNSMFNISNFLVQAKINSFGSLAMAGVSAYGKIDGFIYMPTGAISLAVSTYVGQNIGAGHFDRLKKGVRICLILAVATCMVISGTVILSFNGAIGLFTSDPEVVAFAHRMMWFLAPYAWIFVFSDILGGAMRGAGAATPVTVITALCICVFRIIWLTLLLHFINDIRIVFLCYPVSWVLCSGIMIFYYLRRSTINTAYRSASAAE